MLKFMWFLTFLLIGHQIHGTDNLLINQNGETIAEVNRSDFLDAYSRLSFC